MLDLITGTRTQWDGAAARASQNEHAFRVRACVRPRARVFVCVCVNVCKCCARPQHHKRPIAPKTPHTIRHPFPALGARVRARHAAAAATVLRVTVFCKFYRAAHKHTHMPNNTNTTRGDKCYANMRERILRHTHTHTQKAHNVCTHFRLGLQ